MDELELTAYHEAGHALVAVVVGARIVSLTIDPDRDDGPRRYGDVQLQWPAETGAVKSLLQSQLLVAMAGPVAEMIYLGETPHPGMVAEWAADWREAAALAQRLVAEPGARLAYLEAQTSKLYHRLRRDEYWAAVAAIADELLAHEWLEDEQVRELVEYWIGS